MFGDREPQRLYGAEITDTGFSFAIKLKLFELILSDLNEACKQKLLTIKKSIIGNFVVFNLDLPLITYPNKYKRRADLKALNICVDKINFLLELFNLYLFKNLADDFYLSDKPQLISLGTGSQPSDYPFIFVLHTNFSPTAIDLISKENFLVNSFQECEAIVFDRYLRLFEPRSREYKKALSRPKAFEGISIEKDKKNKNYYATDVYIRFNNLVPYFKVPGICACLSAPPDSFKKNGQLRSHNIFSSLELITMLTAVIVFWNKVLELPHQKIS